MATGALGSPLLTRILAQAAWRWASQAGPALSGRGCLPLLPRRCRENRSLRWVTDQAGKTRCRPIRKGRGSRGPSGTGEWGRGGLGVRTCPFPAG